MTINYCQSYNKIITKEGLSVLLLSNRRKQSKRIFKPYKCHQQTALPFLVGHVRFQSETRTQRPAQGEYASQQHGIVRRIITKNMEK